MSEENETENMLEASVMNLEVTAPLDVFNFNVHQSSNGVDPIRNDDGRIRRRTDWKNRAVDRQGRKYNPKVHGEEMELDHEGYLKVRRRESKLVTGNSSRTGAFVKKYREDGYAYYVANNEGGRVEQMTAGDWEPVMTKDGQASLKVGQARDGNTSAILFKKPQEWYDDDQERKVRVNKERFTQTTSPKEEDGQYEATSSSPLR